MWTSFQGQVCKARLSSNFVVWNRSPAEDAQIIQVFQHVPTCSNPSRISGLDCLKESKRVNMCESLCECMINACEYMWILYLVVDEQSYRCRAEVCPQMQVLLSVVNQMEDPMQRRVFLVLIEEIEPWWTEDTKIHQDTSRFLALYRYKKYSTEMHWVHRNVDCKSRFDSDRL